MKNNTERILKYIADYMEREEREVFEKEIESSHELYLQIDEEKQKFKKIRDLTTIESDTAYFNNLLPKIHEKLKPTGRKQFFAKFAFLLPSIAIGVLLSLNFNRDATTLDSLLNKEDFAMLDQLDYESTKWIINNYSTNVANNFSTINFYEYEIDPIELTISSLTVEDISDDEFNENILNEQNMDEQETDALYNYLIDKKIL